MNKQLFLYVIACLLFFSCQKEKITSEPEGSDTHSTIDCTVEECDIEEDFYWKGFINGECWTTIEGRLDPNTHRMLITLFGEKRNGIDEFLHLIIYHNTDLRDTIWIGWNHSSVLYPNIARASYNYSEGGDTDLGEFEFSLADELTREDYLLIDYVNEDTTII